MLAKQRSRADLQKKKKGVKATASMNMDVVMMVKQELKPISSKLEP